VTASHNHIGVSTSVRSTAQGKSNLTQFPVCEVTETKGGNPVTESGYNRKARSNKPSKPDPPAFKRGRYLGKPRLQDVQEPYRLNTDKVKALSRSAKLLCRYKSLSGPSERLAFTNFNIRNCSSSIYRRIKRALEGTYVFSTSPLGINIGHNVYRVTNPFPDLVGYIIRTLPYRASSLRLGEYLSIASLLQGVARRSRAQ